MRRWLKLTRGPMTRTGSIQPGAVTHLYLQRAIEQLTGIPLQTLAEREPFGPLRLRLSSYIWRERWTNVAERGRETSIDQPPAPIAQHRAAIILRVDGKERIELAASG